MSDDTGAPLNLPYMPLDGSTRPEVYHNEAMDILNGELTSRACRVYHNAAQSITDNTLTALVFNSEREDSGLHSTSSNTGRITFAEDGWYIVAASIQFAANATGQRSLAIRLNGGDLLTSQFVDATSASIATRLSVS